MVEIIIVANLQPKRMIDGICNNFLARNEQLEAKMNKSMMLVFSSKYRLLLSARVTHMYVRTKCIYYL